MNEMTIRLDRNGAAAVPGGQLLLGYAGNRGNYRLRIEQRGEWKGLTVCAHWHTPGASAAQLVENGVLEVPAAVTAVPGAGCITFEGTGGISAEEKQALLAVLRLLAAGNDAAMTAYARLEALWSAPQPPKENVFAVLGRAILGKMSLGRNE